MIIVALSDNIDGDAHDVGTLDAIVAEEIHGIADAEFCFNLHSS